jgi:hypothetical protein
MASVVAVNANMVAVNANFRKRSAAVSMGRDLNMTDKELRNYTTMRQADLWPRMSYLTYRQDVS